MRSSTELQADPERLTATGPAPWARSRLRMLSLVAGVGAGALLWAWTPSDDPSQSVCIWRRTTGVPCPGCGIVRAAAQLAKGDLQAALAYHPLIGVVLAQVAVAWGWWALASTGRARAPQPTTVTRWILANLVALVVVWSLRAVTGTLPP